MVSAWSAIETIFLGSSWFSITYSSAMTHNISERSPCGNERTFLDDVEEYLWLAKMLLILHQADRDPDTVIRVLLERVQPRFPEGHTWLLTPAASRDDADDRFFPSLARQLGITRKIDSRSDFEQGLLDFLADKQGQAFFLVMGIETISESLRYDLTALLHRAPPHHDPFRVVLCGGERLYHLAHADGESSLLNSTTVCELPGFSSMELQERASYQSLSLPPPVSDLILEVTGGHGWLSMHCLHAWGQDQDILFHESLMRDQALMARVWSHGLSNPADYQRLSDLLSKEDLGEITLAWVGDSLLQRLYWQGIVKAKEYTLVWRSACIREMGQRLLATITS